MTDILFTNILGFGMLLVGLAMTTYEYSRLARQHRQQVRLQPQRIDETRGMPRRRGS